MVLNVSRVVGDLEKIVQGVVKQAVEDSKKQLLKALEEENVGDTYAALGKLGVVEEKAHEFFLDIDRDQLNVKMIFFQAIKQPYKYLSTKSSIPHSSVDNKTLDSIRSFFLEHCERIREILGKDDFFQK